MAEKEAAQTGENWFDGKPAALSSWVRKMEGRLSLDRFLDGACTRLYYGQGIFTAGPRTSSDSVAWASTYLMAFEAYETENLIKPVIDACAAQVVRKPAVRIITTGASWKKGRSARKLSRLITGLFSSCGYLAARAAVFRDSARCTVAAFKFAIDPDTGKVTCDRALPHTIVYNPAQGPRGRDLGQRHGLPRAVLMKRYPDQAADIRKLPNYRPDAAFFANGTTSSTFSDEDQVEVCEGWRLAEGKDPGRYVMTAGALVLKDIEWKIPVFPLVVLRFGDSYDSKAGDPLARQVLPFQLKLNRYNRAIEENARDCAVTRLAVPIGAGIPALTNLMGQIYPFDATIGNATWLPGQMLPPQFYADRDAAREGGYTAGGVSRSAAAGMKAPGLNSGRAIREARDEAAGRLVLIAEGLEECDARAASTLLAMMRVAYGTESKRIIAPNTKLLDEIDWSEVGDLKEDEIEVRAYITSTIPNDPAGRAETLEDWVKDGVFSQTRATRWYSNPDTATIEDEESALEDFARRLIETAIDDGKEMAPEPIMGPDGLSMLLDLAGKSLMEALTLPEPPPAANVELLRRLIEGTKDLIAAAAPPPAPPGPVVPGPPAPAPGAQPMPVAA